MPYVWLGIIIFLTMIEAATINLTTIWYVISAIVALIVSCFIDQFVISFGVFVCLGTLLLLTTRPLLTKFIKGKQEQTNFDRILGMRGIVTEAIFPNHWGEVKVDGKKWTAYADGEIAEQTIVEILSIDGVKLKVREWEE